MQRLMLFSAFLLLTTYSVFKSANATDLSYDDFVPGTLRLPPYPDVRLNGLIYDYSFDAVANVGTLDIDGQATNLRFGGQGNDLSSSVSLPIFTNRLSGSTPTSGAVTIDMTVDGSGNVIGGTFQITGGLNPDPRLPVPGGINWIPGATPPFLPAGSLGTAGILPLLFGDITDLVFDSTADGNGQYGQNIYLEFVVQGGELMSIGSSDLFGFGSLGSPGFIELQSFGDVSNLGPVIWQTSFLDTGGFGDVAVPAPTGAMALVSLISICIPLTLRHLRCQGSRRQA